MNPDPVAVACAYLRTTPMVANLVGDRIGTRPRSTTDEPWLQVTLIDERTTPGRALHLAHALLQIDCYAGEPRDHSQAEASLIARTVRAALNVMHLAEHQDAVVTGADPGGLQHLPDEVFDPPRERYVLTAEVHLHP